MISGVGLTQMQILQFTTHILGARPVDQLRYRNRTRLKYRFEAINVAKYLARLMDSTSGTAAVSGICPPVCTF